MKNKKAHSASRREFLRNSSMAAAGFFIIPRRVLGRGFVAPSDKLVIAGIGAGGKGESDLKNFLKAAKQRSRTSAMWMTGRQPIR